MTTTNVEKLVYNIFERKNWIIEQVKQQTYLYEQQLASNLLIQGINPPPWFLNPNLHSISSDPKELNKEELISDLLLPHARPTFPYSTGQCYLQNRLVGTGDNGKLLDILPNDIHDSDKDPEAGDEPRLVLKSHSNDVGCISDCVPGLSYTHSHDQADVGVTNILINSGQSPGRSQTSQLVLTQDGEKASDGSHTVVGTSNKGLDGGYEPMNLPDNHHTDPECIFNSVPKCSSAEQTEVRISNIDIAPDQSLARLQRSKSRQKALELRTSGKATKIRLSDENERISFGGVAGVALYGIDPEEPALYKDIPILDKSTCTNKGSSGKRVAGRDLSNKNGTGNNCGRMTRSRSTCQWLSSEGEPSKQDISQENNLRQHKHSFDCESTDTLASTEKMSLEDGSDNLADEGLNTSASVGDPQNEDNNFSPLEFGEAQPTFTSSLPKKKFMHTKFDSWPQFKRRKTEYKQTNCFSASGSLREQKLYNMQEAHTSSQSKTVENELDAIPKLLAFSSARERNGSESSDMFLEKMECHLTDGTFSSPILERQQEDGKFCFTEQIKVVQTPSTTEHEDLGPCFVSRLSKQATNETQGSFVENDNTSYHPTDILSAACDEQEFQKIFHVGNAGDLADTDILTSSRSALLDSDPQPTDDGPVGSPCNNELAFDQDLPVYEGFVLDEHSDIGGLNTSRGEINFSELNTTCNSMQRASILEQICRNASMCTPLVHFSSTYKPLKNKDLDLSVPNRLLEHTGLTSTLSFSEDAGNHLQATSTDEVDPTLQEMLYSDSLPYSGAQYSWNAKYCDTPVGRYCKRTSSSSISSEKRLSSNPELTCFRIEEDSCVVDEHENADDNDDHVQEDIGLAETNCCTNGEPLSETVEVFSNPPAAKKLREIGGIDSSNAEIQCSVKQRLRNHCSNNKSKNWGKENQSPSMGENSIKVGESLHNRFSKAKLSSTTSIKRGTQRLSEKVKRNNIVSNVTSFIPLVQQKQAAAVCKGKRDIKVRALEAAEAAKRQEEKRENERKMKKEALKLERAKIEQETLKQRELDKRKKEEELKKKDADLAARKRMREEEGRKEKERKRKRIGVGWQTHKTQEEKTFAGKGEKEKQCGNMGKSTNIRKESDNRTGKSQHGDKVSRGGNTLKKPESQTEFKTTRSYIQEVSAVPEICETLGNCDGSIESTSMLDQLSSKSGIGTNTTREKSYEMSPYQHSDDEEEEEDEVPTKKFIPSWASKNCVALVLASQQQIDPSVIFPRESFCSMNEALLPRHLQ